MRVLDTVSYNLECVQVCSKGGESLKTRKTTRTY